MDKLVEREEWLRLVHEALDHLHSRSFLATHPLARILGSDTRPISGEALRQTLLDAIEQVKPVAGVPSHEADARRYRHLVLRYVEGRTLDQVAHALGVSMRQASRDHRQSIDAVAAFLALERRRLDGSDSGVRPTLPQVTAEPASDLPAEIAKLAAAEDSRADVLSVLHGVLPVVQRLAAERQVTLDVSLVDTLPPVAISPTLLRQAVLDLLVYICEVAPGQRVTVTGSDTGRGVTVRIRHSAVEHSSPPGDVRGAQLMLGSARQLLAAQGGQVEVEADAEETRVRLVLPPVPLQQILLVDDNPDLVGLFRRYVRGEPYRVIQAMSGEQALQLARNLRPDVIILDVMMPSQDGWAILQRFRADPEVGDIPVILCSVLPEQTLARSLGVIEFLPKPVTRSALLAVLRRLGPIPEERRGPPAPNA